MGNNAAYTEFEEIVMGIYHLGSLDRQVLAVIMNAYRDCDIDSGGSRNLVSTDGKGVEQIVIETLGGTFPVKPVLPYDWKDWTDEQDKQNDKYYEEVDAKFRAITKQFGW